jgi:hypothetical protein
MTAEQQTRPRMRWWLPLAMLVELAIIVASSVAIARDILDFGNDPFYFLSGITTALIFWSTALSLLVAQLRQRGGFVWGSAVFPTLLLIAVFIGLTFAVLSAQLLVENADDLGRIVTLPGRRGSHYDVPAWLGALGRALVTVVCTAVVVFFLWLTRRRRRT